MGKRYRVIVSKRASQMLVECAAFLAQVSVPAAERLIDDFEITVGSLESFPLRCSVFSAEYIPKNSYRYIIFGKRYCALFQIKDDTVFVDYVLDCRADYSWLFAGKI